MTKSSSNSWQWQNQSGYSQAVEVPQSAHTIYCAGQAALDAEGRPVNADRDGQISLSHRYNLFDQIQKGLRTMLYETVICLE